MTKKLSDAKNLKSASEETGFKYEVNKPSSNLNAKQIRQQKQNFFYDTLKSWRIEDYENMGLTKIRKVKQFAIALYLASKEISNLVEVSEIEKKRGEIFALPFLKYKMLELTGINLRDIDPEQAIQFFNPEKEPFAKFDQDLTILNSLIEDLNLVMNGIWKQIYADESNIFEPVFEPEKPIEDPSEESPEKKNPYFMAPKKKEEIVPFNPLDNINIRPRVQAEIDRIQPAIIKNVQSIKGRLKKVIEHLDNVVDSMRAKLIMKIEDKLLEEAKSKGVEGSEFWSDDELERVSELPSEYQPGMDLNAAIRGLLSKDGESEREKIVNVIELGPPASQAKLSEQSQKSANENPLAESYRQTSVAVAEGAKVTDAMQQFLSQTARKKAERDQMVTSDQPGESKASDKGVDQIEIKVRLPEPTTSTKESLSKKLSDGRNEKSTHQKTIFVPQAEPKKSSPPLQGVLILDDEVTDSGEFVDSVSGDLPLNSNAIRDKENIVDTSAEREAVKVRFLQGMASEFKLAREGGLKEGEALSNFMMHFVTPHLKIDSIINMSGFRDQIDQTLSESNGKKKTD